MTLLRTTALLLVTSLAVAGCKKEIRSGDYGPVTIGQTKLEALAALKSDEKWPVRPVLYQEKRAENPSREILTDQFSEEAGILVWIGGHPWPLRIEFEDDRVSRTWPEIKIYPTAPEEMKAKDWEVARLKKSIESDMSRDAVFGKITDFQTGLSVVVGNFVVGEQRFRGNRQKDNRAYNELLLANDAWLFNGLEDKVWYNFLTEPWMSTVTIYFKNDRIERIEHEHFPIELP